jgi:hypothetical protein
MSNVGYIIVSGAICVILLGLGVIAWSIFRTRRKFFDDYVRRKR